MVADFGARRAHNIDAAVYGARAAYIGGAASTATVLAGELFDIPVSGTMAHSWVMYHDDEYTAFKRFAELYPDNSVLLVDTYDVLESVLTMRSISFIPSLFIHIINQYNRKQSNNG